MMAGVGYSANAAIQDMYSERPLRDACQRIARGMVAFLEREVTRRTPVARPPPGVGVTQFAGSRGRTPGTLKRSWQSSEVRQGSNNSGTPRWSGDVFTEDPIAPHVEYATRPHLIRPRLDRRPASVVETGRPRKPGNDPSARLRFVNRHGQVVYAREVHHPGTQGSHMMRDSLMELDATWADRIGAREMKRWAREQQESIRG